jgi:type II secretory pathway pseudopilin PulG
MSGKPTKDLHVGAAGFTLVELVIIIVILGILAAVAIPKFGEMSDSSKDVATRKEMNELRRAIVGSPDVVAGGRLVNAGFEGDTGKLPGRLEDLVTRPDSIAPYDRLTRLGWNGPYIDGTGGSYLADAWGVPYQYNPALRQLQSVGGSDTIAVTL